VAVGPVFYTRSTGIVPAILHAASVSGLTSLSPSSRIPRCTAAILGPLCRL
jgi:hypothetical protein